MTAESEKSTGEYIAEAYQEAVRRIQERNQMCQTPAEAARREQDAEKEKQVRDLLSLHILSEEVTETWLGLEESLRRKKSELEKLYGITLEDAGTDAVQIAEAELAEAFQTEYTQAQELQQETIAARRAEAAQRLEALRTEAEEQIAELTAKLETLTRDAALEAEREEAEYAYQLERDRKGQEQKRAADVAAREQELRLRETRVQERRAAIEKRIEELDFLQKSVESIPAQLEAARAGGVKKAEKALNRAYGYERALAERDRQHRIDALKAQYDRLFNKYQALEKERDAIAARLDQCNAESRALTSDTVRSIGGINILAAENRPYAAPAAKK